MPISNPPSVPESRIKVVRKTTDEVVNNSDVLQDDDELFFAIDANDVYFVDVYLFVYTIGLATDFKFDVSGPAGASFKQYKQYSKWDRIDVGTTPASIETTMATNSGGRGGDTDFGLAFHFLVINGANGGNVNLRWAQNAAAVENTIVRANSFILTYKLN